MKDPHRVHFLKPALTTVLLIAAILPTGVASLAGPHEIGGAGPLELAGASTQQIVEMRDDLREEPAAAAGVGAAAGTQDRAGAPSAGCAVPSFDDRCEAWTAELYDGSGGGADYGGDAGRSATRTIATSPDGTHVYTLGISQGIGDEGRWAAAVHATDAETSETAWTARFAGTAENLEAFPSSLAIDPSGEAVYLVATVYASDGSGCVTTSIVSLDASDGSLLSIHEDPQCLRVLSMELSADGSTLFYGGTVALSTGDDTQAAMFAAALDVGTPGLLGQEVWRGTWTTGPHGAVGNIIDVAPDGSSVYVTGGTNRADGLRDDITTVAFEAGDPKNLGAVKWVSTEPLTQPEGFLSNNGGLDVDVTPDGSTVLVSGVDPVIHPMPPPWGRWRSAGLIVAYDANSGERLWGDHHVGPTGQGFNDARFSNMAVSPDGERAYVVTKHRSPGTVNAVEGTATLAYDTSTGEQLWAEHSWDPRRQIVLLGYMPKIAVSPDGDHVVVTSARGPYTEGGAHITTIGYDAATGEQAWIARHWGKGLAFPVGVTIGPDSQDAYVAGNTRSHGSVWFVGVPGDHTDMLTVAYTTE